MRQKFIHSGLIFVICAIGFNAAWAQTAVPFPTKAIRLIVPFAAGGPADVVAREIGQILGKELGQTLIIENQGGAAGVLAFNTVARAPADGYTLLFAAAGNIVVQPVPKGPLNHLPSPYLNTNE